MEPQKTEVLHIRIPTEVMRKVREVAKREERTHAFIVNRVLREWSKNGRKESK
jgi:hypothetical protein